jgi:undecaprenyl-diphosphatase
MFHYIVALIQGIVEGLTEFLPISSTGHLILSGHLLGFTDEKAKTFEIVIQLAAILAVVTLFFKRFMQLIPTPKNNGQAGFSGIKGLFTLFLTTLPALIVGFLLHDFIKENLFSPKTVVIGLILGGLVLIWFENLLPKAKTKSVDEVSYKQALGIGLAQVISIWPGVSRAASTIVGGSFLGLDRKSAVEYSFFAAVPIMLGATVLDLAKSLDQFQSSDAGWFILGMIVSYLTALFAIKFLLRFIEKHSLATFGYYRLALASLVILLMIV